MITSSQNPKLKLVRALAGRPKERREAGAFLAEGVRLVEEALAVNWPFRFVLYADGLSARGMKLVKALEKKIEVEKVEGRLLQSVSETATPQGVLAVLEQSSPPIPPSLDFVLIPDSIREPGNLGALLRTAAAAGVQAVLLPPENTDAFAPKVVRAGMGAHFKLPIHMLEWEEIEKLSKSANLAMFLGEAGGRSCWETDLRVALALIVGGEAEGPSEGARESANQRIGIPMVGKTESLNAAVAGSILMMEVVRQRG